MNGVETRRSLLTYRNNRVSVSGAWNTNGFASVGILVHRETPMKSDSVHVQHGQIREVAAALLAVADWLDAGAPEDWPEVTKTGAGGEP